MVVKPGPAAAGTARGLSGAFGVIGDYFLPENVISTGPDPPVSLKSAPPPE
jgi:hypothetical protein